MSQQEQIPAIEQDLQSLREQSGIGPLTEADQTAFDTLETEVHDERAQHLQEFANPVSKLVEVDGIAAPVEQVQVARDEGQDVSIHATAGRRS